MKKMHAKNKIHEWLITLMALMMLLGAMIVLQSPMDVDAADTIPTIVSSSKKIYVGQTVKLKAKCDGKTLASSNSVVWKSSNKKVATIGKHTGKLIAKKAGTSYITVTYQNNTSASYLVTVNKKCYLGTAYGGTEFEVNVVAKSGNKITVNASWCTMRAGVAFNNKKVKLKKGVASFTAPVYGGGGARGQKLHFKMKFSKKTLRFSSSGFNVKLHLKK